MTAARPKLTLTQRKRLDILAAARAEFLEAGFRDTSMDRVAERAQVSKRTVYNHFPSKEDLFRAITQQFIDDMRQAIRVAYDPARPLADQLRQIAEREVAQVTAPDYVAVFRVFLAEVGNCREMFREILAETGSGHDPIETWIQAAVDDDRLRVESVALAANQFTSLLKGALFWPLVAGYRQPASKQEQEAVIGGAVDMFLGCYAA